VSCPLLTRCCVLGPCALAFDWLRCVHQAPSTTPAVALLRQCCSGLFSTLVTRRLEIAVAVVQAGIDDDNPYEDPASLEQHVCDLSVPW